MLIGNCKKTAVFSSLILNITWSSLLWCDDEHASLHKITAANYFPTFIILIFIHYHCPMFRSLDLKCTPAEFGLIFSSSIRSVYEPRISADRSGNSSSLALALLAELFFSSLLQIIIVSSCLFAFVSSSLPLFPSLSFDKKTQRRRKKMSLDRSDICRSFFRSVCPRVASTFLPPFSFEYLCLTLDSAIVVLFLPFFVLSFLDRTRFPEKEKQ